MFRTTLLSLAMLAGCFPRIDYKGGDFDTGSINDSSLDSDDSGGPDTETGGCTPTPEVCDGVDNDCDGMIDEDLDQTWYADYDADGYGDAATSQVSCAQPTGYVADGTDCDPAHTAVNPGATEVCDGIDNDCDGSADIVAVDATTWYADRDADRYGDETTSLKQCDQPAGYVSDSTDCDDTRADIHPGASETDCADATDYNCDGSTGYADADGDSFAACEECDDGNAAINPDAVEVCDALNADENCNGTADNDDMVATGSTPSGTSSFWPDADGDAWGSGTAEAWCDAPAGYADKDGDCDDSDVEIFPGQMETCSTEYDDNCDASDDDMAGDASNWYPDNDGDGYGATGAVQMRCNQPAGYIADDTDCDDGHASINPAASEVCDALDVDEDCNGLADEADGLTCSTGTDADRDGIDVSDDCDDMNATIGLPATYYADNDSDGYGDASSTVTSCSKPVGSVTVSGDCDDTDASVNPGATEVCDALDVDEDCNGAADELDGLVCTVDTGDTGLPLDTGDTADTAIPGDTADTAVDTGTGCVPTTETCNGIDDDCDGSIDDGVGATYYADADGDSYGDPATSLSDCSAPSGYVSNDDDCDDNDPSVNPGATELNTVLDEDCDGNPFQDATLTTLSGAVVTIASSTNGLDNESATFDAGTTGSWTEVTDRLGTQVVADMGPYGDTWSATGGLDGGIYNGLALYTGNATYTICDEKVAVTATVSAGTDYVLGFTARNTAGSSNDIGVYVDGVSLGTATLTAGSESFLSADFTATASTATIWLCTGTVQGGVDATQFGVFETL